MMSNSNGAKARAEGKLQARQGATAWAEHEAQRRAVAEKTERLRALRLAKETVETPASARQMHD